MAVKGLVKFGIFVLGFSGVALVWAQSSAQTATPAVKQTELPAAPAAKDSSHDNYVIGDGDQLAINVWKEQELTVTIPVRSDGKISLPLIGEVQASGKTPVQLKDDISSRLKAYLSTPDVTVTVLQMNSQKFNILGRVSKPGSFPLQETTTVLDAIASAGGFLDFAKQKNIYILRKNSAGETTRIPFNYKDVIKGNHPEQNIQLKANDTIVVP